MGLSTQRESSPFVNITVSLILSTDHGAEGKEEVKKGTVLAEMYPPPLAEPGIVCLLEAITA